MNTHFLEIINLNVDDGIRKAELWNSIFQHATYFMQRLKHMNLIASLSHIPSEAQACRP